MYCVKFFTKGFLVFCVLFFLSFLSVYAQEKHKKVYVDKHLQEKIDFIYKVKDKLKKSEIRDIENETGKLNILSFTDSELVVDILDLDFCYRTKSKEFCNNLDVSNKSSMQLDTIYYTFYFTFSLDKFEETQLVFYHSLFPGYNRFMPLGYDRVKGELYFHDYNFKKNNYRELGNDSKVDHYKRFEDAIDFLYHLLLKYT